MRTIREAVQQAGVASFPISLRQLAQRFEVSSLNNLIAAIDIAGEYRRRGDKTSIGALGAPVSQVFQTPDRTYKRDYQFGSISKPLSIDVPRTEIQYFADIFIAAVKCFGTEDPGGIFSGGEGEDEPYLIITTINPSHVWLDQATGNIVKTWKSQIFEDVTKGEIFCQEQEVFKNLAIGRHGISLKIALLDHEHGDAEELRQKVEEKGRQLAQEALSAASALAGVNTDEALSEQAMNSEIGKLIQDITFDAITDILKDDKIDEKTWRLDGTMLKDWVDTGFTVNSDVPYPPEELPSHIKTNFPRENIFDTTWLFSGGGGSYKVYLRVIPYKACLRWDGRNGSPC
jgi:hypothetical protein